MKINEILEKLLSKSIDVDTALQNYYALIDEKSDNYKWVKNELQGYGDDKLPDYRIMKGNMTYSYFINGNLVRNDNFNSNIFGEVEDDLITMEVKNSVGQIALYSESGSNIIVNELIQYVKTNIKITEIRINLTKDQNLKILNSVKLKLIDILKKEQQNSTINNNENIDTITNTLSGNFNVANLHINNGTINDNNSNATIVNYCTSSNNMVIKKKKENFFIKYMSQIIVGLISTIIGGIVVGIIVFIITRNL